MKGLYFAAVMFTLVLLMGCQSNKSEVENTEEEKAAYEIPERERILEPYIIEDIGPYHLGKNWVGGLKWFSGLQLSAAKELVEKGYLDPNGTQNYSPTVAEFLAFMKKWEKYDIRAHGYEVSKIRDDTRVTIAGLSLANEVNDEDFLADWKKFNGGADELTGTYSWWD